MNDYTTLIFAIGFIMSFKAGGILLVYSRLNNFISNLYLSFSFILTAYGFLLAFLIVSGNILKVPFLYQSGYLTVFLGLPLPFLYMRSVLKGIPFRRKDLLMFLPVLVYLADIMPYLFLSSDNKIAFIHEQLAHPVEMLMGNHYLLPEGSHLYLCSLVYTLFIFMELRLYYPFWSERKKDLYRENKVWFRFFSVYLFLRIAIIAGTFYAVYIGDIEQSWHFIVMLISVQAILSMVYLIYTPSILYGLKGLVVPLNEDLYLSSENELTSTENEVSDNLSDESSLPAYLNEDKVAELKLNVAKLMAEQKPYLQPNYSINDLAKDLDISARIVSAYLNKCEGSNFFDFINEYRVKFIKNNLLSDDWNHLTLEAIAQQAGFNNRTSFSNAFKKFTGQTPSSYLKEVKNPENSGV